MGTFHMENIVKSVSSMSEFFQIQCDPMMFLRAFSTSNSDLLGKCYKTFFGGNLDFPKIKTLKKVCSMSEPAQKCENHAIIKQNYTLKLFISFKISHSCYFGQRGNREFPDFLHKKFYNVNYCWENVHKRLRGFYTMSDQVSVHFMKLCARF